MVGYYTITILLQSSYLPDLPDPSRSKPSSKQPNSQARNQSGARKDADSHRDAVVESTTPTSQKYDTKPKETTRLTSSTASSANIPSLATAMAGAASTATPVQAGKDEYFNTAHRICTELSNVVFHHVEIMLERYTQWCSIQTKINHALIAAQRVVCLNARLNSTSTAIRDEAKAGFKMGSDLYKRLALLPAPLVIYDRPPVEDIHYMNDLDRVFEQMVVSQNEERENQQQSMEQGIESGLEQQAQDQDQGQNQGLLDGFLGSYVIDTDDQDGNILPTSDEIQSQGLQIFGGEGAEGYAFEFDETSISMKGSFSLLLDPHTITE
jgi:hypothetical protein